MTVLNAGLLSTGAAAAAPTTAPPACGAGLSEVPCNWWRGVNLYSGFSDQFGPAGSSLSSQTTQALDTITAQDANNYVVYVPELDTDAAGAVTVGTRTVSDQHLITAAGYAAPSGTVAAVLKPHIDNPTNFAGGPAFLSTYSAVLAHYGRVATGIHAKVFVIATELSQIYTDPSAMNALIDAAASTYDVPGGQLAVAINWDQLHAALSFPWLSAAA